MKEAYPLYWPEGRKRTAAYRRQHKKEFRQGFARENARRDLGVTR